MAYEEYPLSKFPDEIDNFDNMQDITASLVDPMVSYQTAISNKDFTTAANVIANNPDLLKVLINAYRINSFQDGLKATQKCFKEDVQTMVTHIAQNTIGINDSATGDDKKTNAYSGYKTEYLSGITLATNITINITDWNSDLEYTYTNSSILADDEIQIYFADESKLNASKAFIYVKSDTGAGNFILKANKVPKSALVIDEIRLVRR
ncbi:hypothetical protein [Lacrimispora indolis]|uniref:hypothetical protein n=1 Tax=Lacrimispora indolis TaxID=69825 RepID=UPI000462A828|nr:hypothetical protein [[Clostridium] methoxybenzovorans]